MPQENQSSYVKSTIATVAILGAGALLGYLVSDANENPPRQHGNGGQNRHQPLPSPPQRNQPRDRSQECGLCYRDINCEPSKTMACRHRVHQQCWQRMQAAEMTCPTCSDNVFPA